MLHPFHTSSVTRLATLALCVVLTAGSGFGQAKKHKISPKQANALALKRFAGTVIRSAKLEHEDGRWQYEVVMKLGKKWKEVDVDAETGKISNVETTSAAEEAKEAKHGG